VPRHDSAGARFTWGEACRVVGGSTVAVGARRRGRSARVRAAQRAQVAVGVSGGGRPAPRPVDGWPIRYRGG
jgi:hypothetical protein